MNNLPESFSMQVHHFLLALSITTAVQINAQVRTIAPPPPVDTVPPGRMGEDSTRIFEKVEIEASFPGSESGWRQYLVRNLNANTPVDNGAPVGKYTVWAQFIVDKTGAISDVKALTTLGYGMEQEVLRIIRKGPNWVPAYQSGRAVKAYRRQPVTFIVTTDEFEIKTEQEFTLYTKKDNRVTVTANRVKNEDIDLVVPGGTVTPLGDAVFNIRVNKAGRVIVEIHNKKKNRKIGDVSMEVVTK